MADGFPALLQEKRLTANPLSSAGGTDLVGASRNGLVRVLTTVICNRLYTFYYK